MVVVSGEVGAGKTTLIRGACRALGVEGPVTSPTFTIGQRYSGGLPVSHLDLYRLGGLEEEEPALLDDYLDADAIAFVEWPAAAEPGWPAARRVEVRLGHAGGDSREVELPVRIPPRIGVFRIGLPCSIARELRNQGGSARMKGLKTLIGRACWRSRCWRVPRPPPRRAAAYRHYVACGVSQNAKPAHVCQKARKKGAFFRSNNADVFYTVCVKFPTGKNLCARAGSGPGDALREQDHLEHPRRAHGSAGS